MVIGTDLKPAADSTQNGSPHVRHVISRHLLKVGTKRGTVRRLYTTASL